MINDSFVKVNGINIFYRDTKSGDQSMLLLHGRWGSGETWTDFINRYQDKYRIIAPDQRGHGLSSKPEDGYTAEDFAKDAFDLLKYLNCSPTIIVGHSMGGRVAGYLASLYPQIVKAVAILDENAEGLGLQIEAKSSDPNDDGLTLTWPTPYPTYDEALKDLKSRFRRETNVRYFLDSLAETTGGYDFIFSRKAMALIGRSYKPWYNQLTQIMCPVFFVRAVDSWCLSKEVAEKMKSVISNYTYCEIDNSDHMVYVDNPEQFYPRFDAFLNKI